MRFFSLLDFQHMAAAFFLGLTALILIYIAWKSYPRSRVEQSEQQIQEKQGHELGPGLKAQNNPIAPFLVFIYIIIAAWSFLYTIVVGIEGGPF